jgi:hypothetical protein
MSANQVAALPAGFHATSPSLFGKVARQNSSPAGTTRLSSEARWPGVARDQVEQAQHRGQDSCHEHQHEAEPIVAHAAPSSSSRARSSRSSIRPRALDSGASSAVPSDGDDAADGAGEDAVDGEGEGAEGSVDLDGGSQCTGVKGWGAGEGRPDSSVRLAWGWGAATSSGRPAEPRRQRTHSTNPIASATGRMPATDDNAERFPERRMVPPPVR